MERVQSLKGCVEDKYQVHLSTNLSKSWLQEATVQPRSCVYVQDPTVQPHVSNKRIPHTPISAPAFEMDFHTRESRVAMLYKT